MGWILKLLIYALILVDLYIFVKLSKLRVNGVHLVKLKYRILIALFFPIIILLILVFGSIIFSIVLLVLFIIFLGYLFSRITKGI